MNGQGTTPPQQVANVADDDGDGFYEYMFEIEHQNDSLFLFYEVESERLNIDVNGYSGQNFQIVVENYSSGDLGMQFRNFWHTNNGSGSSDAIWQAYLDYNESLEGTPNTLAAISGTNAIDWSDEAILPDDPSNPDPNAPSVVADPSAPTVLTGSDPISVIGGPGDEDIEGNDGNNHIDAGGGQDRIDGRGGFDTSSYQSSAVGVTVSLLAGRASDGDTLSNVEAVSGSDLDDVLVGDNSANALYGNAGNDTLDGLGDHDLLEGGDGDDTLTGGAGNDTLVGGTGTDTANYTGTLSDYSFLRLSDGRLVVSDERTNSPDGVDEVLEVELLAFVDGTVAEETVANYAPVSSDNLSAVGDLDEVSVFTSAELLAPFSDLNNDTLTISAIDAVENGTAVLEANGDVTFTPASGYAGISSFTYTVTDSNGGFIDATMSVLTREANVAPVASDDTFVAVSDGGTVTISALPLLLNDTDSNFDELSLISVQSSVGGTVIQNANGEVEFTPNAGFEGTASFSYTVSDGRGGTSTATATVFVSSTPAVEGTSANETLNGTVSNDLIRGNDGSDMLFGLDGDDILAGGLGDDYLEGGAGSDQLVGGSGTDTLVGGAGDDVLEGQAGSDTYRFSVGDGADIILDGFSILEADIIELGAGIDPSATLVRQASEGVDLVLDFATAGDSLTLDNRALFGSKTAVEVRFDDGTVWTGSDLFAQSIAPTTASQTIYSSVFDDILVGGAGDDTLIGRSGDDQYQFDIGDGRDVIRDNGSYGDTNTVVFGDGIAPGTVEIVTVGDDIELRINAEDVVVLERAALSPQYSANAVDFASGETWNYDSLINEDRTPVTDDNPPVAVTNTGVAIKINLIVSDPSGGSDCDDSYYWVPDVGYPRFGSTGSNSGSSGGGIGILPEFEFSGGTCNVDVLTGTNGDDFFFGGIGNDTITSREGDDTFIYASGDGNDLITEQPIGSQPTFDTLELTDLIPADVQLTRNGNDLFVDIISTGESIEFNNQFLGDKHGINQIVFPDGTIWDEAFINTNVFIRGTPGNDTLSGSNDDDRFIGGAGDDTITSREGNDVFIYGSGDGNDVITEQPISPQPTFDTLDLINLTPAEVQLTRSGNDLFVDIIPTGASIELNNQFLGDKYGINQVVFSDGTIWDEAFINTNVFIRGTSGNDTLSGSNDDDRFIGGAGDDTITSREGNDTFIYASGDGNDVITEQPIGSQPTFDTLELMDLTPADIQLTRNGRDLFVDVIPTDESIEFDNQFLGDKFGINQISFSDGTVWNETIIDANVVIRGAAGNDALSGTDDDDVFEGGAGDDTITSRRGDDTFLYGSGDGNDVINEQVYSWETSFDTLRLLGLAPADADLSYENYDLIVDIVPTGDAVRVRDQFRADQYGIEEIEFSDGSSLDRSDIEIMAEWA